MQPILIVHHHEITLKGGNRNFFERQLMKNVKTVLSGIVPPSAITGGWGKFIIELAEGQNPSEAVQQLTTVFGLANIYTGIKVEPNIDVFCSTADQFLQGKEFRTLKVETKRPDKRFPLNSVEVNIKVGAYLCDKYGVRANLTNPDETIYIEIADGSAYVCGSKVNAPGGLPVGVSGKVVSLLSAGFDSPVASWRMMKRGCKVIFVHFHSMPYTSQYSVDQVRELTQVLTKYQFRSRLYTVPFADVQNEIVLQTPPELRIIFYRRFMIRIAEVIARKHNAEALATGEAVGQVASQTLRNIRAIDEAATLPILRPLCGMDKEETMVTARQIGTYDISKEPYDDCCSFLAPRRPETWADPEIVRQAETKLDINKLVDMALNGIKSETFTLHPAGHDKIEDEVVVEEEA